MRESDVIDVHVHLGGPAGENEAMYFWSESFQKTASFEAIKLVTGLGGHQVTGLRYLSVLLQQIQQSRHVDRAVLLGLDMYHDEDGVRRPEHTNLFVANAYLEHMCAIYPEFLYGCSVHPYCHDALERLWRCARGGAVLCKWLPSSMGVDPTHPLAVRFYRALAALDLPLLIHVGREATIPSDLSPDHARLYNSAAGRGGAEPGTALDLALDAGASVIVAHCATPLGPVLERDDAHWQDVYAAVRRRLADPDAYPRLYGDVSAFCLPGRLYYVKEILPLIHELPLRFLYGSDYPVPVVSLSEGKLLPEILRAFEWLAGRVLPSNDFDKNYELLERYLPAPTFTAATRVLRDPQAPFPDLPVFLRRLGAGRSRFFSLPRALRRLLRRGRRSGGGADQVRADRGSVKDRPSVANGPRA
jgi:predicted TIM-barrel fold metal-dependent hydrolase